MKILAAITIFTILSVLGIGVHSLKPHVHPFQGHGSGPEDQWTAHALEMLGNSPQLLNLLLAADLDNSELLKKHLQQIPVPQDDGLDAVCTGCTTVIGTLNTLIHILGIEFDDIRDPIVNACVVLANSIGANGDVLCPGTVDNYGPHVYEIIKIKRPIPAEACGTWNYCPPELPEVKPGRVTPKRHVISKMPAQKRMLGKAKKKDAIKLVHMTDIHVDHKYMEGAATSCGLPVCCRLDLDGEGAARRWGEYACNIPPATTEAFLRRVAEFDPDLVVYTGDNPPHSLWEETQWGQLNVSRWVAHVFGENFPGKRSYPVMGNHETYPSNLYYMERPEIQELNREWYKDWAPLAGFDEDDEVTINNAGYYTKLHQPGLRVLAYNSNYGYTENWYVLMNDERQEYVDMKNFLSENLAEARDNGEKVILLGHHPSGGGVLEFDRFMADLTQAYSDVIVLHVMGHTHNDEFRVDVDDTGAASHVEFVGQTMNSRSNINPGFRIFYLDPDTFQVQDYEQFYINLRTVDEDDEDPITFLYSAAEEFGLDDMSAQSWRDLLVRMEEDDELFQRYYRLRNSNSNPDAECTGSCKVNLLCRLGSVTYERQLLCRRDAKLRAQHRQRAAHPVDRVNEKNAWLQRHHRLHAKPKDAQLRGFVVDSASAAPKCMLLVSLSAMMARLLM